MFGLASIGRVITTQRRVTLTTRAPKATTAPTSPPPSVAVTVAPVTAAPVTAAPVTAAPVTAAPVTAAPVTAAPVTVPALTSAGKPTSGPKDSESGFVLSVSGPFQWVDADPSTAANERKNYWEYVDKSNSRSYFLGFAIRGFTTSGGSGYAEAESFTDVTADEMARAVTSHSLADGLTKIAMPGGTAYVGNTSGPAVPWTAGGASVPWKAYLGKGNIRAYVYGQSRADVLVVAAAIARAIGSDINVNQ